MPRQKYFRIFVKEKDFKFIFKEEKIWRLQELGIHMAAKKYTQTLKDIERAEKTGDAYYNALGGVVERTSHWYVDEDGNFSHFAYVRRDDKLNKKIRKEAQEKAEELIEKTGEKAVKARKEQQKKTAEKLEERRTEEKSAAVRYGENIVVEFSKDGMEALLQKREDGVSGFKETNLQK